MQTQTITTSEYADKFFKQFSLYDCQRSIPHAIDGLKITQRKIIYSSTLYESDKKVLNLVRTAARVAFDTDYHHGEVSIMDTIVKMAQDFTGKNNINLMIPDGQFGSILDTKASAPRYIHTRLSENFRKYFKKEDDAILIKQFSDNHQIEPKFYIPILPFILINGSEGIATGYANFVLNYNEKDIIKYIKQKLNNKKTNELIPYYKGFTGTVVKGAKPNQWVFTGVIEKINSTKLVIKELPIGKYLDNIKTTLKQLLEEGGIKDYDEDSTIDGYNITVTATREFVGKSEDELIDIFNLTSTYTMNITCWTHDDRIRKFNDVYELLDYFIEFRLKSYDDRKQYLLDQYDRQLNNNKEKIKFIKYYLDNSVSISKMTKKELEDKLSQMGFINVSNLLDIRIYNLTHDNIISLEKNILEVEQKMDELKNTTNVQLYLTELNQL